MLKRLTAHFSGTVQGVGFRFTVQRIARRFDVTGFVRNLPDGRVELQAEGKETVLKDFMKAVLEGEMAPYIRETQAVWSEAEAAFQTFSIRM